MVKFTPEDKQVMIDSIRSKLIEIDEEEVGLNASVPAYMLSFVETNKPKEKIVSSLELFLSEKSLAFTEWLLELAEQVNSERQKKEASVVISLVENTTDVCMEETSTQNTEKSPVNTCESVLEEALSDSKDANMDVGTQNEVKQVIQMNDQALKDEIVFKNEVNNPIPILGKSDGDNPNPKRKKIVYTLNNNRNERPKMTKNNPNEKQLAVAIEGLDNEQNVNRRKGVYTRLRVNPIVTSNAESFKPSNLNAFNYEQRKISKKVFFTKEKDIEEGELADSSPEIKNRKRMRKEQNHVLQNISQPTNNSEAMISNNPMKKIKLENSSESTENSTALKRCVFWPDCRNMETCKFLHPRTDCKVFPNCIYGNKCRYIHPTCKFTNTCRNSKCIYLHPKKIVAAETRGNCKFYPNCKNVACPYIHPKPCRFGQSCPKKSTCYFNHSAIMNGETSTNTTVVPTLEENRENPHEIVME